VTTVSAELSEELKQAANAKVLLSCWDFDGTLAPIVSDPEAARPMAGAIELLSTLAGLPDTWVALLSGRARADLARLSGAADPVLLVGSHGVEFPPGFAAHNSATQAVEVDLQTVLADVERLSAGVEGVNLEVKRFSVAVHVRNVADRAAAGRITHAVLEGPGQWPGVHVTTGKEVVELAVARGDKGEAITALRQHFAASVVTFTGDDVTDERGFAVMGPNDVSVKVGPGQTAARFRVDSPQHALEVLRLLVALRAQSTTG
jgi:trehalose 6-phosphate phosphatase